MQMFKMSFTKLRELICYFCLFDGIMFSKLNRDEKGFRKTYIFYFGRYLLKISIILHRMISSPLQ